MGSNGLFSLAALVAKNLEVFTEDEDTPSGLPEAGISRFWGRERGLAFCHGKGSAGMRDWVAGTALEGRNFLSDSKTKKGQKDQLPTEFLPAFLFMTSGDPRQNPGRPGEQSFIILKKAKITIIITH